MPTLICDYLECLGVPHTEDYSNRRFKEMPFQTMFGLVKLLEEYGIKSEGYYLKNRSEIDKLCPPFLARTPDGYVIVTDTTGGNVHYLTQGQPETIPVKDFMKAWDGNVLLSFPEDNAMEPDYNVHARIDFFMRAKKWVMAACLIVLFIYLFVSDGLYKQFSLTWIAAIDLFGLYVSYLLVQKSLKVQSGAADRFCGILQAGGCDSILELKASKFFGLFGWSEVGLAYFSVSLLSLLLFPETLPMLALCNVCCLPFTVWSIWYQRFRAGKWCTLCVCVQCSLWLLFFGYLGGGWLEMAWPPTVYIVTLGLTYLAVMLLINAVTTFIENISSNEEEKD